MARKKNTGIEGIETTLPEGQTDVTEVDKTPAASQDIPESVSKLLKTFCRYEELWITPKGGIFTTKPAVTQGAILYKNPFYNS